MVYTQAQSVVIGLYYRHSDFADDEWKPMDEDDVRFLTGHLLLSCAAGKISFTRPVDGEWDLKTEEQKKREAEEQAAKEKEFEF